MPKKKAVRKMVDVAELNSTLGTNALVVYADDGKYYVIKENEWKTDKYYFPAGPNSTAGVLIKRGTILADVPVKDGPPVGYACKLVNVNALNRGKPKSVKRRGGQ